MSADQVQTPFKSNLHGTGRHDELHLPFMDKLALEAFEIWYREWEHKKVDLEVKPFLGISSGNPKLKEVRLASLLSTREMAKRMGVSHNVYIGFENNEMRTSVENLRKCAAALNCEFIFVYRPRERCSFGERVFRLLMAHVKNAHNAKLLASGARFKFYQPEFRKRQGWKANSGEAGREIAQFFWKTRMR